MHVKFVKSKTVFSLLWFKTPKGIVAIKHNQSKLKGNPFVQL